MIKPIPKPASSGLILSYKCPSACRHCIYGCSPQWSADWMPEEMLENILSQLAGKILLAPYGPDTTSLNHGLHFTGGEPFVNFPLLCRAVELAAQLGIPSTFVETNAYWCVDDRSTREKLDTLKRKGLRGILISANAFYLEHVPFERTVRATRISFEVFGRDTMVYQLQYFQSFLAWSIQGTVVLKTT
jgi:MoaA/NifB/PqqE/SkfB family radical SAM enzyme